MGMFFEHWKLIAFILVVLMFFAGNPKLMASIKDMIKPEHPYERRKEFFSPAELNFDTVLRLALKDNYRIMGKVRVADLLQVKKGVDRKERPSAQNKINGKHIDFVLLDPKTQQVACCIELDDSSHARKDRIARDVFLNTAFDAAKLPLLRIPCKRTYQPDQLAKLINRAAKMSNAEIRKMVELEIQPEPQANRKPTPKPKPKPQAVNAVESTQSSDKPVKEPIISEANLAVEPLIAQTPDEAAAKQEAENLQNFAKYLETYNKT